MKTTLFMFVFFLTASCKSYNLDPIGLVGKWSHTYQIQQKDGAGNWGEWITINIFAAIPVLEFTKDGKILYDGKTVNECCNFTNYSLNGTDITATNQAKGLDCSTVKCGLGPNWKILNLDTKIVELEQGSVRNRYSRLNN